jgi:DNA-directed RNA polymerase subunit F
MIIGISTILKLLSNSKDRDTIVTININRNIRFIRKFIKLNQNNIRGCIWDVYIINSGLLDKILNNANGAIYQAVLNL